MTEENVLEVAEQSQPSNLFLENQDWFLEGIIENVINHGVDIGITLSVNGAIVSGILISGKKYFEELSEMMAKHSQNPGDIMGALAEGWKSYTVIYEKPEDAPEDWTPPRAAYIHLRDARYFAPGQAPIPTNMGVLWRGKLSEVDGFSIGNMSKE